LPPTPSSILAIDPGATTGWAKVVGIVPPSDKDPRGLFTYAGGGTFAGVKAAWEQRGIYQGVDIIVVEDFRIYPHKAQALIGRRLSAPKEIGRIELLALLADEARSSPLPIHYQMASQAKQLWPDSRIREKFPGFYKTRLRDKHTRDALRHLFTFMETYQPPLHDFFNYEEAL